MSCETKSGVITKVETDAVPVHEVAKQMQDIDHDVKALRKNNDEMQSVVKEIQKNNDEVSSLLKKIEELKQTKHNDSQIKYLEAKLKDITIVKKDDTNEDTIQCVLQQIEKCGNTIQRQCLESKLERLLSKEDVPQTKNERDSECYQLLLKYHELKENKSKDIKEIKLVEEKLVRKAKEYSITRENFDITGHLQERLQKIINSYEEQVNVLERAFRSSISKVHVDKTNERKIMRDEFQRKKQEIQTMCFERVEKLEWLRYELGKTRTPEKWNNQYWFNVKSQPPMLDTKKFDIPVSKREPHESLNDFVARAAKERGIGVVEWLYMNIPNSSKLFKLQMDYALKSSKYLTFELKAQREPKTVLTVKAASEESLSFIIKYIKAAGEEKLYTTDIHGTKAALKFQALAMDRYDNFILDVVHDSSLFDLHILNEAAVLLYRELFPNVHV